MGQGHGKGGQGGGQQGGQPGGGRGGLFGNVLRNGPTPFSDALVQQETGSERHIVSQRVMHSPQHETQQPGATTTTGGSRTTDAGPTDHMHSMTREAKTGGANSATSGGGNAQGGGHPAKAQQGSVATAAQVAVGTTAEFTEKGEKNLPVMIRLNVHKRGEVQLHLEHKNWDPIPMSPSGSDSFFALVSLPKGLHKYRFTVDGHDHVEPSLPQASALSGGQDANVVEVKESAMSTKEDDDPVDDPNGWGQERIQFEETKKAPPILPPHLRYSPLNTPFTQYRQDVQGSFNVQEQRLDPENIPLPLSVTINHCYFQRREDHTVLGVTTRYRSKFSTIVYYKGAKNDGEGEALD